MSEKPKKPEDPSLIDKHLNSKLFQKFLQKEGDKLTEVNIVQPRSDPPPAKNPRRVEVDLSKPLPPKPRQVTEDNYTTEPKPKEDRQKPRFLEDPVENPYKPRPKFTEDDEIFVQPNKSRPKFSEDDEIFVQPNKFQPDSPKESFFRQVSNKSPINDRPLRPKWQEDPYQPYKEEEENFPRDSELKGFSDYIPPGESFVYYENLPENPIPKTKSNFVNYYPDPLVSLNSNNQQIQNLEEQLRNKDIEINQYRQDIDHYKSDIHELEEKLESVGEMERRMKNLRAERDMIDRKTRGIEEENEQLKRQVEKFREDLDNARYKMEDIERSAKNRVQEMEREIRGLKDRIADLEHDLSREKDRNRSRKVNQDEYQDYGGFGYDDDRRAKRDPYYEEENRKGKREEVYYEEPRKGKRQDFYEEEPRKGKRQEFYEEEPRKGKRQEFYEEPPRKGKKQDDFYQDSYQDTRKPNRKPDPYDQFPEKGFSDRNMYEKPPVDDFRPDKIKEQVKARIGATNSSSVSSALNWGEKPRKNDEVLNLENKILSLQIEKKRFEDELAKLPEHAKKIAVIRRREEVENELAGIHSNIASLKIRVKQLQAKENN